MRGILEDIGVDYGLDYLGEMQFQKLTYVDNNVPSLSIGGFTNGVRVVDMAKGYSTLANGGVYNDRTCITKIIHEHDGELTKDLKPSAHQVYRDDSAFMLTDVLKGTFTASYGTGQGLGLDNDMPAAGKPVLLTAARIPGSAATPVITPLPSGSAMIYQEICLVSMVLPMQEGSGNL